jgi:hypothetical protein
MPELGKKYTCYSCHTKFYDLGKPIPKCPKCGADQRDADEAPVVTTTRGRSRAVIVEPEPIEDPELAESETPAAASDEEEDEIIPTTDDREEQAEDEEEEEY